MFKHKKNNIIIYSNMGVTIIDTNEISYIICTKTKTKGYKINVEMKNTTTCPSFECSTKEAAEEVLQKLARNKDNLNFLDCLPAE